MKRLLAPLALLPLLFLWPALRHAVEGSMALHMLVQFPLLLAGGFSAARLTGAAPLGRLNAYGLLGMTAALCVAAFWMIPAALDLSLLSPAVNAAKYASWWVAGALLGASWAQMRVELAAFFLGNMAWMLATAGLLFRDAETRLCVNYLVDEQIVTGNGLLLIAVALLVLTMRMAAAVSAAPSTSQ